jgi:hypothetical protein
MKKCIIKMTGLVPYSCYVAGGTSKKVFATRENAKVFRSNAEAKRFIANQPKGITYEIVGERINKL